MILNKADQILLNEKNRLLKKIASHKREITRWEDEIKQIDEKVNIGK